MVALFGFEIKRKAEIERGKEEVTSFVPKETDDGSLVVAPAGAYGTYVDIEGSVRTEAELITRYREMALHPECDGAVDEIVNDSITLDNEEPVSLNLDDLDKVPGVTKKVKDILNEEFTNIIQLLRFHQRGYDIYRHWYVDGRLYYHAVIDEKDPKKGIQELRYIDPRKIRKIREVEKIRIPGLGLQNQTAASEPVVTKTKNEYYVFNERGFGTQSIGNRSSPQATTGLRIATDAIVYVPSGIEGVVHRHRLAAEDEVGAVRARHHGQAQEPSGLRRDDW